MANSTSVVVQGDKLGFKVGPQSSVNTMLAAGANAGATPGYFYLTDDEHRLYVGNHDGSLSPVNQGVTFVQYVNQLPVGGTQNGPSWLSLQGQFYYVQEDNILCVCSDEKWVQINPDTYLKANQGGAIAGALTTSNGINKVTLTTTVQDTQGQMVSGVIQPVHTVSGYFAIQGSKNVGLSWDSSQRTITLTGPDSGCYKLETDTTTVNNNTVPQIVLRRYTDDTLTTVATDDQNNPIEQRITFVGDSYITPTLNGSGQIQLSGAATAGMSLDISQTGSTINFILSDSVAGEVDRASITPQIQIEGANGVTETKTFTLDNSGNLTTNLGVYSKARVDQLITQNLQGFEAMHFAGTLDNGNENATISLTQLASATNISSGATYKVVESFDTTDATTAGITIDGLTGSTQVGDLIIVTGIETNGVITSNAHYTYVPSGDDTDIYWTPSTTTDKKITFAKSVGGDQEILEFTAPTTGTGAQIDISASHDTSGAGGRIKTQTISISHHDMGTPTVTGTAVNYATNEVSFDPSVATGHVDDYTAITGLTLTNGHVTGYKVTKLDLWSDRLASVTSVASAPANTTNTIKLTSTYANSGGQNASANHWQLSSNTLEVSALQAGNASTTADIHIDMVWGSFT